LSGPITKHGFLQLSATEYLQPIKINNDGNLNTLVVGKEFRTSKLDKFICWSPSPEATKMCSKEEWEMIIDVLDEYKQCVPDMKRGESKKGICQHYMCFGWRKDMNTKYVGKYCLKPNTDVETRETIHSTINNLVKHLETVSSVFFNNMSACEDYKHLQKNWQIPTLTEQGYFTQCSIGYNYQSNMHVDKDYMYTVLTCYCRDITDLSEVIYYFCFPECQIRIPLYNGSVLVFDPSGLHCATNPMHPNSYIMSCYVSSKTVDTHVSTVVYQDLFNMEVPENDHKKKKI
jgi:hypothetical protein